jgi:hypothetical protein
VSAGQIPLSSLIPHPSSLPKWCGVGLLSIFAHQCAPMHTNAHHSRSHQPRRLPRTPADVGSQVFAAFLITGPKVHKYHLVLFSQLIENCESHKPIWPNGMGNVVPADFADFGPIVHKSFFQEMPRGHLGRRVCQSHSRRRMARIRITATIMQFVSPTRKRGETASLACASG